MGGIHLPCQGSQIVMIGPEAQHMGSSISAGDVEELQLVVEVP